MQNEKQELILLAKTKLKKYQKRRNNQKITNENLIKSVESVEQEASTAVNDTIQDTIQDTTIQDTIQKSTTIQDTTIQDTIQKSTTIQDTTIQDTIQKSTTIQENSLKIELLGNGKIPNNDDKPDKTKFTNDIKAENPKLTKNDTIANNNNNSIELQTQQIKINELNEIINRITKENKEINSRLDFILSENNDYVKRIEELRISNLNLSRKVSVRNIDKQSKFTQTLIQEQKTIKDEVINENDRLETNENDKQGIQQDENENDTEEIQIHYNKKTKRKSSDSISPTLSALTTKLLNLEQTIKTQQDQINQYKTQSSYIKSLYFNTKIVNYPMQIY
jgi:hypothetical protein